jgi:hypothetical protein
MDPDRSLTPALRVAYGPDDSGRGDWSLGGPMLRKIASACLLVVFVVVACSTRVEAKDVEKGSAFLSFMLYQGDGDFIGPESFTPGSVSAYDHSEWGGEVQYQYLFNEHWAFSPSAGIGTFGETDSPGVNALPGEPTSSTRSRRSTCASASTAS